MTGSLQVKNGLYYIVINQKVDGKRTQKWIKTKLAERGNKRKADQLLKETLYKLEHAGQDEPELSKIETNIKPDIDTKQEKNELLFNDYLTKWLKRSEKRVDEVTMQGYRRLANKHIIPYFKGVFIADIDLPIIQKFIDSKSENGRLDGKGGLSPKSVRELKNIVNQVLNSAIKQKIITSNPCSLLDLPAKNKPDAKFYSAQQLNSLLSAVKEEPLYPVIKTAIVYGLRRSELQGIKWDSVDFDNNALHIIHTVVRVTTVVEKDKTKNQSSRRSYPLMPEIRDMFIEIKKQQEYNRKIFGKEYIDTDYVFCWPNGKPFSPDYISHKFSKLLKQNGFPHIRFHELRHSCASVLINKGKDLKTVQEWMGHADISITSDIYGHLETQRKIETADMMANLINS